MGKKIYIIKKLDFSIKKTPKISINFLPLFIIYKLRHMTDFPISLYHRSYYNPSNHQD